MLFRSRSIMLNRNRSNNTNTSTGNKASVPKDKYVLGASECSYELADYIKAGMDRKKLSDKQQLDKVIRLFTSNETMYLAETEGRSLKVMLNAKGEIKFLGFITAGDASLDLSEQDIPQILEEAQKSIVKAISVDELIDLF